MNDEAWPTSARADKELEGIAKFLDSCQKAPGGDCSACSCKRECEAWWSGLVEKSSVRYLSRRQAVRAMTQFEKISPKLL